jgi:hypothetical protein
MQLNLKDAKLVFKAFYWLFAPPLFLLGVFFARQSVGSYPGETGASYLIEVFVFSLFISNAAQIALLWQGLRLNRTQQVLSSEDKLLLMPAAVVVVLSILFQIFFLILWRSNVNH